jgi:hypothetical protein
VTAFKVNAPLALAQSVHVPFARVTDNVIESPGSVPVLQQGAGVVVVVLVVVVVVVVGIEQP